MIETLRVKLALNITFAIFAALGIILVVLALNHNALVSKLGDDWTAYYANSLNQEAKEALAEHKKTGDPTTLSTLITRSPWASVALGDRAYLMKRKMLATLSISLRNSRDYALMMQYAKEWIELNDRDLDARAFYYEALRHTPGREKEGLEGLELNQREFPANFFLTDFLIDAYQDTGASDAADRLISMVAKKASADYLSAVWRIFWKTATDERFSLKRSIAAGIEAGDSGYGAIVFDLPRDATELRIDPPRNAQMRISTIKLLVGGQTQSIEPKRLKVHQMLRDGEFLIATGDIDPQFIFPINLGPFSPSSEFVAAALHFKAEAEIKGSFFSITEFVEELNLEDQK